MSPLQLLVALVAFVWASPVVAQAPPTSTNDPFRAIAAQVPRKPDYPICCLKPALQPLESLEDEVLLPFEEWKQKQSVLQEKERAKEREANNRSTFNTGGRTSGDSANGSDPATVPQVITAAGDTTDADEPAKSPTTEPLPPHFRVPLTDRFNYASLECSARVHLSHRSAKSTSSILSSKRDRYMLSPCNPPNKEKQFVVVELCEDIRIDTVQLANFEFFSGIFKDFRISVAKTYITGEEGWTDAGVFRAKNIRGVQSFHPPTSLRDFYRYIRIDFLSHYGNEYYCPVSLLRAYGLTHLEQWKWDIWEQESRAKLDSAAKDDVHPPATPADSVVPEDGPETASQENTVTAGTSMTNSSSAGHVPPDNNTTDIPAATAIEENDTIQTSILIASVSPLSTVLIDSSAEHTVGSKTLDDRTAASSLPASADNNTHDTPRTICPVSPSSAVSALATHVSSTIRPPNVSSTPVAPHKSSSSHMVSLDTSNSLTSRTATTNTSQATAIKAVTTTTMTSTTPVVMSAPPVSSPVVPVTTGGESIYRTIMNRLTALEGNHTLYVRYVEQQTSGVRELLRRLGEDVGRLEGIGKAQSQTYQRTVRDWEKRQQQLQMDYGELMARVEYLSDEIVLEKRLGIAQLCLLLAVLVFMGLTRGSRGDQQPVRKSMREWSRRHLSFSGEWTTRFRGRGRSGNDREEREVRPPTARPAPISLDQDAANVKVEFPTSDPKEKMPLKAANMNARSASSDAQVQPWFKPRSRTPSMRNTARHGPRPPATPTSSHRPRLQRSNSQGGTHAGGGVGAPGSTHKSARRWARTAHLHEVRSVDGEAKRRRARVERENEVVDVFASPGPDPFWARKANGEMDGEREESVRVNGFGLLRKGKEGRVRPVTFKPPEEGEGDTWVDTDLEESEGGWYSGEGAVDDVLSGW